MNNLRLTIYERFHGCHFGVTLENVRTAGESFAHPYGVGADARVGPWCNNGKMFPDTFFDDSPLRMP